MFEYAPYRCLCTCSAFGFASVCLICCRTHFVCFPVPNCVRIHRCICTAIDINWNNWRQSNTYWDSCQLPTLSLLLWLRPVSFCPFLRFILTCLFICWMLLFSRLFLAPRFTCWSQILTLLFPPFSAAARLPFLLLFVLRICFSLELEYLFDAFVGALLHVFGNIYALCFLCIISPYVAYSCSLFVRLAVCLIICFLNCHLFPSTAGQAESALLHGRFGGRRLA